MNALIQAAIERYRTTYLVLFFIFVAGIISYSAIPKESSPDIPIPVAYVSVNHEGISPEDAVNLLIKPLEKELKALDGLDTITANAFEGGASIQLEFDAGFDNEKAITDVREKVDMAKAELPDEADEPIVTEINIATFPILTVILSGQIPERTLKKIAEDLQDEIETLTGVLETEVYGTREAQVIIEIDQAKLESYNLTQATLADAVSRNNLLVAAGALEMPAGRYAVKVPGLFKSAEEIYDLPIYSDGTRSVRMRDIGTVSLTFKDPVTITRVNGDSAVTIDVKKRIGENVIDTVDGVKDIIKQVRPLLPEGLSISYTSDESIQIRNMLTDLENNVLIAVLLVMIVILASLGRRTSLLVAMSIPGAFLMGIISLYAMGYTTNIVVLFALILSVGMLVDGAIVVTELADKHMLEDKMPREKAYLEAAKYMAWPIAASTATTLAAFVPLLFWPGIMGEFMKFMPITLIATLTGSFIMAVIFMPALGAKIGKASPDMGDGMAKFTKAYTDLLAKLLEIPGKVLLTTVGLFFTIVFMFSFLSKGVEFFPRIEPERAEVKIHALGDLSIYEKDKITKEVEARILGIPEVKTFYVNAGSSSRGAPDDVIGNFLLEFHKWKLRDRSVFEVLDEIELLTNDVYGVRMEISEEKEGPSQGKPIALHISGPTYAEITPVVKELRKVLENIPGTTAIDDSLPEPGIQWSMDIDRVEATKSGASLAEVGAAIRMATTGVIVGTYRPDDSNDEWDITARFAAENRSISAIDDLVISTSQGNIPISHFMTRNAEPKVTAITRIDRRTTVTLESDVKKEVLPADIVKELKKQLKDKVLPDNIQVRFEGQDEEQKETQDFLGVAFLITVGSMFLILVMQFDRFYQAGIILSAIVLSTAGVLMGHMIMGKPFGIVMSGLGIIALAGIVVNNNIVLIDTFNKLVKDMHWKNALIETGRLRLRPVLLTAITTIVGLMPMALKLNIDLINRGLQYNAPSTQWWDQLASSIAFGLAFATVLTLIVTPCMIARNQLKQERKQKKSVLSQA